MLEYICKTSPNLERLKRYLGQSQRFTSPSKLTRVCPQALSSLMISFSSVQTSYFPWLDSPIRAKAVAAAAVAAAVGVVRVVGALVEAAEVAGELLVEEEEGGRFRRAGEVGARVTLLCCSFSFLYYQYAYFNLKCPEGFFR
jgi:hypothetical protein